MASRRFGSRTKKNPVPALSSPRKQERRRKGKVKMSL
jgi:hypothetical protein